MRRETARRLGLRTLSDLAGSPDAARRTHAGFHRPADGLPGLEKAYGVRFRSVRALLPAVKYQALAAGEVDVIDGYSTDGFIARYDLVMLAGRPRLLPAVRGGRAGGRLASPSSRPRWLRSPS